MFNPSKENISLYDCFDPTEGEVLDGDNHMNDKTKQLIDAAKRFKYGNFIILIISLKI